MRIRTLALGFDLTPAVDEAVRTHFGTALHAHADTIDTVDVLLEEGRGNRRLVTASVYVQGRPALTTQSEQSSLYAAIAGCSRQSKRRVRRTVERARRFETRVPAAAAAH
jgi:ribosome-associated translation inhibitor RaiA